MNPVLYYRLVEQIVAHWTEIETHIDTSKFSFSKPTGTNLNRAVVPADMFDEMEQARLVVRARAPYGVRADVNQFYGTLYSHSIPWALHTKAVAEAQRNNNQLCGNVLDRCVRNAQDGQTIGVPIGPDTSLVIAELILSSVDQEMANHMARNAPCRRVDDYEIRGNDRADAERQLANLQQALTHYELTLNPKKSRNIQLPCAMTEGWRHDIRRFRFNTGNNSQRYDLLAYYDKAFRAASECPDDAVLKYAVARMRSIKVEPDNWPMHERFLHRAMIAEPGLMSEAVSQLIRYEASGLRIDRRGLAEVIARQIQFLAPQGHGTDVA